MNGEMFTFRRDFYLKHIARYWWGGGTDLVRGDIKRNYLSG